MTPQKQPIYYIFCATDTKTNHPHWYRINANPNPPPHTIELSTPTLINGHIEWSAPVTRHETLESWCNYAFTKYHAAKHDQQIISDLQE